MANGVKWIKLDTDIFDDEKMVLIESMPNGTMIELVWVKLLTLAGKNSTDGIMLLTDGVPYTPKMLSTVFRIDIDIINEALHAFTKLNMIKITNDTIVITKWNEHQSIEAAEKKKKRDREYQQKRREQQKTPDPEQEPPKEPSTPPRGFLPPTVDEITEYCLKADLHIKPDEFFDYYTAKGWMLGNVPMLDWKATVRTWAHKAKSDPKSFKPGDSLTDPTVPLLDDVV